MYITDSRKYFNVTSLVWLDILGSAIFLTKLNAAYNALTLERCAVV